MNRHLLLLTLCQGLLLTNNVTFIAINGLVGLRLAPAGWMSTLPVMAYVVGGALSTGMVARIQARYGRQRSFQTGLLVAALAALLCAWATWQNNFWLLVLSTCIAGYYNANGGLYRFAAAELSHPDWREKAVSLVMAGGLIGAVAGPFLATRTRDSLAIPFVGAYLALSLVALLGMLLMAGIRFAPPPAARSAQGGRPLAQIVRQPLFIIAAVTGALGYGVMNLLMTATPLAMQHYGLAFADTAQVMQWHVVGMFAPGFFTGHLIRRFGALPIMGTGLLLTLACVLVALSGSGLSQFLVALFLLGVGWNFLYTGSTTLSLHTFRPEEKDRAQAVLNFTVFATLGVSALSSGVLVSRQGWAWLQWGSLVPITLLAACLLWLLRIQQASRRAAQN